MAIQDNASLALIPSGYKSGLLYSVIPDSGNGDFTHSRGSTATRVNAGGFIETMANDVPRLDYPIVDGVVQSCPALLLEPSRTNYVPRSVFDAAVPTGWSVGFGTGTYDHELTTFMGQPAIKHTQITSGRSFLQYGFTFLASTTYTCSFYVDLANCGDITSNETIVNIILDDDTGQTSITFGEIDQDTGFASFTFTTGTHTFGYIRMGFGCAGTSDETNKPFVFSMPQVEIGSYATSYIPTSGSPVTRSADVCNNAGTSAEFNDSEGVLFAEIQGLNETDNSSGYITLNDGSTTTNAIFIQYRNTGELRLYNGGTSTAQMIYRDASADLTENIKLAIKYGTTTGSYKVYINGFSQTLQGSFVATAMSGLSKLQFAYSNGTSNTFRGKVKQLMVFKTALSDSDLATLTS